MMVSTADQADAMDVSALSGGGDVRARIDALNERAYSLRATTPRDALALGLEALGAARAEEYRAGEAYALLAVGSGRTNLFELDAALLDLHAARALFEELEDSRGLARATVRIGSVLWRKGEYSDALSWLLEALPLHRENGDRESEADTLNTLGNVYHSIGDYARALEAYHASMRLYEEAADPLGLSFSVNNIGNIHGHRREYEQAMRYHERALALKRELGDRAGEAIACSNLGASRMELGEDAAALELYRKALELGRESGERNVEANVLGQIGEVHRRRGDPEVALEHLRDSLEVSRASGLRRYEAEGLLKLGETLIDLGRVAEGLEHLEPALALTEELGSRQLVHEAHLALSKAYEAAGDAEAALRHFKLYHDVEDEVFSGESERRIQGMLVQTEIERSHREADLLREKNDELVRANEALRRAEEEQAHLLEQLRAQAKELERLSRQDALTGLYNRRHLDEALTREWERAKRFMRPLAVAMADLDHFKEINDRFSHAAGDAVLRALAALLREGTRSCDVVARYGGEEFVIVLVETTGETAAGICERLREAVEAHDWSDIHPELRVTISIGLSADLSVASPEALLAAADARLYEAKRAGRNRVI